MMNNWTRYTRPEEAFSKIEKKDGKTTNIYYPHSDLFCAFAKIYTLSDKSGNVFYVGCTTGAMTVRLAGHLSEAKRNSPVSNKRKNAAIIGLNFEIVATIVEMKWVTAYHDRLNMLSNIKELEKSWIKKYMNLGYKLCNREATVKKILVHKPEFVGQTYVTKGDKITTEPQPA